MIVYNNQAPDAVNNVGQFGATEGSIGAYKQAAEYASDAKYWALLAESKFSTVDELIAEVERLYKQGILIQEDIEQLKEDFAAQDVRLMQLISEATAAASNANNAADVANQKIVEIQLQLDILLNMAVTTTTLPAGSQATGTFDPTTGKFAFGIPQGQDGSVTDLGSVTTGVPMEGDLGFYVDKTTNSVYKTTLEDIANLIPSVRSVSLNGGPAASGEVDLTVNKATVGLSNVKNVASYSETEINGKLDGFTKLYKTKTEADADAVNRLVGEHILVWNGSSYEFYTVAANKTLTLVSTEGKVLTVNSKEPDSTGNIDILIPTGNPSLYLGEITRFPLGSGSAVTYPGLIQTDGSLVERVSYPDLGASLVQGNVSVVSETTWQAGEKDSFSWGKLSDGITDADSTNYINIRVPLIADTDSMRSYVVASRDAAVVGVSTVDGVAGAVDLTGKYLQKTDASDTYQTKTEGASKTYVLDSIQPIMEGALFKADPFVDNNTPFRSAGANGVESVDMIKVTPENSIKLGSYESSVQGVEIHSAGRVVVVDKNDSGVETKYPIYSKRFRPEIEDLPFAAIGSYVKDSKGRTIGVNRTGINSDIKQLTQKVTFTQPVTVADAVEDGEAITYRQLKNYGSNLSGEQIKLERTGLTNNLPTNSLAAYQTSAINAVTDYGMVADFDPSIGISNGTNNATAMQQMIDDVIAAGGNAAIHIPAGNYRIKRLGTTNPGGVAVTLGTEGNGLTNVVIEGDGFGTVIHNDDIGRLFGLYGANTVTIRNMKIVGYGGGTPASSRERDQAFALGYNCKNVIFDNVYIDNFYGDCIYFGGDLENGSITGKQSRDVIVRNCILKERYGNGIRSWDASNTGTRSRLAIAVIDVVGLKIHDNLIYGEIDLEPNSSNQNMQFVEVHDNTFRSAGVTAVTNPYECEPLYTGTTVIRGGVTLQTVASNLTTTAIVIRDNLIEYGRIRITGGTNAARVSCTNNRIRRGGIFLGHYSGTNSNPYMYVSKNQIDGSFNNSDDANMEDWITVGSIPSAAFFIQGSLSNCRVTDNVCGSYDAGFTHMFYLLSSSEAGGLDLANAGGRNTWINNLANNTTALRNYTPRPTDFLNGEVLMPSSGVPRTEVIKQVTRVEINPVVDLAISGTNQTVNYTVSPSNKYRVSHTGSASISSISGYVEETGMRIQLRSSSASASNTLTLVHSNSFFLKGQENVVLNSTRYIIVMEMIEPGIWVEVSRNF